jgi:hypothetical protein
MSELDEMWQTVLVEAERRARVTGRGDLADYVALRAVNDAARRTGVNWLLNTFQTLAGEANRVGAGVTFERDEQHRFSVGAATMAGTLLTFRYGVRELKVAAGWPRAPGDGFVRLGGLACARIQHFGMAAANEELLLVRDGQRKLLWFAVTDEGARLSFPASQARWHVGKFLGVNQ